MPPSRRERQYAATSEEIKATARRLMAAHGTAGVSLRAIAREMDMTAPALYHYFAGRDALITALILDAFNALADALEQVRDSDAASTPAERLMAVALAYRGWALAHPIDFQLIYGNPIPGYEAPREITVPAATRGFVVIVELIATAMANSELMPTPEYRAVPPELERHLAALREHEGYNTPLLALYLALVGWPRMHGIIMLELFNHIQPVVGDSDTFYRIQIESMSRSMGLSM
jgi:AcrR family transcriptional regulator